MSPVAERLDTISTEHARFVQGRGANAPAWLRDLRQRGAARFAELGFPTVRQEEWRFTNVAPIADTVFRLAEAAPTNAAELASRVAIPDIAARIVILNGRFAPELSSIDNLPAGLVAGSLARALADTAPEATYLAQQAWEHAPFIALNTAFLEDGAFITIAANAVIDAPVHVVFINGGAGKTMAHPRTLIVAGANSRARIAQSFLGSAGESHFTNVVTEVSMGENAMLDVYTDQREIDSAYHIASTNVHLQRGSTFKSRAVTLGGKLLRNDIVAVLAGEGAHCALDGCYLVDGDRLVDNHTTIDHATPHCTSHELYKGILDGRSRAVFNGRIIVREDAQKTDAKQTNRALLLSDDAQINSNPQLEIFADDVKCTHGAAIGQLNEDALFYLRARGLTERDARDMLIHAYAGEVLEGITIDSLRLQLERELFTQLDRDLADHKA
ncbi:MAG TPA: Fe-S cluster assembly protein SufD [Vicinamibacterales bacterium]|nr:Fe-S cluster assembly protein SufD [Vicinamibacterales bacterium]